MLRDWFAQWGLPRQLRVDTGAPWGGWRAFPPDLAWWLLGLGIAIIWNRPRHKQGTAVIERAHGVCQRWVEAKTCPSAAVLQARLDWATTLQRERYPAIAGQRRLAAYPALAAGGHPYDPTQEAAQWEERRVWDWLAPEVWTRRVDKVGRISLAGRPLTVGKRYARQDVVVRLIVLADAPYWSIRDAAGQVLRQHPAPELSRDRIIALEVSQRRSTRRPAPAKPSVHPEGHPYAR